MKKIILFVIIVLNSFFVIGQSPNYQQQYLQGKEYFNNKKYNQSKRLFQSLFYSSTEHIFSEYSLFYYALSAYYLGELDNTLSILEQILKKYPSWNKTDDVYYWKAIVHFEKEEYFQAYNVLGKIKSESFEKKSSKMKEFYLSKIKNTYQFQSLLENYKSDSVLAFCFAKYLYEQPLSDRNEALLSQIIKNYNLNQVFFRDSRISQTIYKDKYKVAIMLPFMVNDIQPNLNPKPNQFVLDLYQGMVMAVNELRKNGISIDYYAYDTKRSNQTTSYLLKKEEFKGFDLIIGPLFSKPVQLVNDFSNKNAINFINPLSGNFEIIKNNPYAFLFFTSNEKIGEASAHYVQKHVKNKYGIVYYDDTYNELIKAQSFISTIENGGYEIVLSRKISKSDSRDILDDLLVSDTKISSVSREESKESYNIKLDSVGYIFVASNEDLITSKILSAVNTRGDSITIIGSSNWLDSPITDYKTCFELKTVFHASNYIDTNSDLYQNFRKKYLHNYRDIPDKYTYLGFELMYLLGNHMKNHGKYFQHNSENNGFLEGYFSQGIDYTHSNDNSLVPFMKFNKTDIDIILQNE